MGIFRPDRSGQTDEALLLWKVRLFVIGAGLGIGGMVTETPWVLWSGVGVLIAGVALRFAAGRRDADED